MAIGGFINGLRPVNLAKVLLQKAGVAITGPGLQVPMAPVPQPVPSRPFEAVSGPAFSTLVFSRNVAQDGRPINPAAILPSGGNTLYASFEYAGMQDSILWGQVWAVNGQQIAAKKDPWDGGSRGRRTLSLVNQGTLPDGEYHLVLTVNNQVLAEGKVVVGRRVEDTDTQISGKVVDAATRQAIPDVLVIALRPDVRIRDFLQQQRREMMYTSAHTDRTGHFTFPQQLPKGQAYGLVVVARGYRDLAIESALRITANAPEQAEIDPIALQRE
jgi:hypothetical protein